MAANRTQKADGTLLEGPIFMRVLRIVWLLTVFQIAAFHTLETIYIAYPVTWTVTSLTHFTFIVLTTRKLRKKFKG